MMWFGSEAAVVRLWQGPDVWQHGYSVLIVILKFRCTLEIVESCTVFLKWRVLGGLILICLREVQVCNLISLVHD